MTSVKKVISHAAQIYGNCSIVFEEAMKGPHETNLLSLDISKSKTLLGISPRWNLEESIFRTINWYQRLREGVNAEELCLADINKFIGDCKQNNHE